MKGFGAMKIIISFQGATKVLNYRQKISLELDLIVLVISTCIPSIHYQSKSKHFTKCDQL